MYARYQEAVRRNAPDEMANLFAPDGVLEFPFTLPGMRSRVEGREAIRSWLRDTIGRTLRFEAFRHVVVHDTGDPEVVIAEHDLAGALVTDGSPVEISYVYVLRARAGQIVHLRDYADLLALADATGGLARLTTRVAAAGRQDENVYEPTSGRSRSRRRAI